MKDIPKKRLNRRDFLRGGGTSNSTHITSLLVSAKPTKLEQVESDLNLISIVEVAHVNPLGKIIVTMETTNESDIVQALSDIQLIDSVVSAALVFHQVDDSDIVFQTTE